jgi:hypothetical protein
MSLTETKSGTDASDVTYIYDEWGRTVIPDSALEEILGHADVEKHDEVHWYVEDGKVTIDVKPKDDG